MKTLGRSALVDLYGIWAPLEKEQYGGPRRGKDPSCILRNEITHDLYYTLIHRHI